MDDGRVTYYDEKRNLLNTKTREEDGKLLYPKEINSETVWIPTPSVKVLNQSTFFREILKDPTPFNKDN